jgi:DNA polymerase elongation subunit (family B)
MTGAKNGSLLALPDTSLEPGVLPLVIKSLVERRRAVKKIMKNERNPEKPRGGNLTFSGRNNQCFERLV